MVREIIHDTEILAKKCEKAGPEDAALAQDLRDTLEAHSATCVGLAANMLGVTKRVIAVSIDGEILTMFNPKIVYSTEPYEATEGCLSLAGMRKTTRYNRITVSWQDEEMNRHRQDFTGWGAQIIQHEVDHCRGILI